ncbi:anaerobic sulfatase maturase [Clostridium nigeriense]|uniref:anaerobic sulfatase maturase n=1 Tax=Clostridium nigeriense TaxID=1805470 RepID=UPI00082C0651|nr:anaerobic sulfatase maturase [Clostridium nigeriense]
MKRNLSLMIKPSSSKCNLNCKYCFYHSIAEARDIEDYGFLKEDTLKVIIEKASDYCNGGSCVIGFQGGEPLLIGLNFYKKLIEFVKDFGNNTNFSFSLQTNGTLITDEWAEFFSKNNFLIGLSLDGNKDIHNLNRVNYKNEETFNKVMRGIKLLQKYNVEFNILTVVTSALCKKIESTYNFFKKNNFKYLQFIPCLEPLENTSLTSRKFSITKEEYKNFLMKLFDLWYEDAINNNYVSIRMFDNILGLFFNQDYEACDMKGVCSCQHIIESDGSVYPCDFYTYETYKIGNILTDSFNIMHRNTTTINFLNSSINKNSKCNSCKYYSICRNGCRRHRENQVNNLNYFCEAYYDFYSYSIDRFNDVAFKIKTRKIIL